MRRVFVILPLVPVVLLGVAAVVALRLNGDVPSATTLSLVAVGCLLGLVASAIALRGQVASLKSDLARISVDRPEALPKSGRLGLLGLLVPSLDDVVVMLRSARAAATTDLLTGAGSRGSLLDRLFDEVDRAARYGRPLSIAFIDLDRFKSVNDTYGHEAGDVVLRSVAGALRENLRSTDFLGRYGGEEFVLVLPETTVAEASAVAEKLRLFVLSQSVHVANGTSITISVSIGIAGGLGKALRAEDLIRDADAAMYAAKSLGRNQTYVFEEPNDGARIPRAPISPAGRHRAAEVGNAARRAAEASLAGVISPLPHYRGKPSSLIAAIAVSMARELGLPPSEVERIRVASLLHDIGKVGVPEQILEKPGPLDTEEWQSVVQHPQIGQVIIDEVAALQDAGAIILHHHERFSGHGYPHGLHGTEIPLGARIVAIADAYDAMVHDRPYKRAISHADAVAELRRFAGPQFDPSLVELFCDRYTTDAPVPDPSLLIEPALPLALVVRAG